MNERLVFLLLLCVAGVLWSIIGYWRRKTGEAAFAAARMADKAEERRPLLPYGGDGRTRRFGRGYAARIRSGTRIASRSSRSSRTESE